MTGLEEAGERYKAGWETETKAEPKYKLEKPDQVTDENIEQNYEPVRNMEPVAILKGTEFDRGEKTLDVYKRQSGYTGSANQNTQLLNTLRSGSTAQQQPQAPTGEMCIRDSMEAEQRGVPQITGSSRQR